MKVFQRMAHAFQAEGCTATFGMMGDGNMFWLHELHNLGVKVHEVRHEGAGLGMADGWARATRQVGVATATCGPGTTQLATAFVTASRAESPLVAFCGEHPVGDPEYSQRFNPSLFAEACEAGFVRMHTADQADEAVRKAFYLARTESRPILLSVPMDLQQEEWEDDDPYKPSSTLITPTRVQPDPDVIKRAADLIAKSKNPVIIVGRGAQWADAGDVALKLGERVGALMATSLLAKTWLNDKCEYHAGISGSYASRTAMKLMHEADVVIGIGASLNRYTMENGYLYPDAKIIQIDSKPQVLMAGVSGADLYIHADAKVGAAELEKALAERKFTNTGYRTPEVKQKLVHHWKDPTQFDIDPGTMDPRPGITLLDEIIPTHISTFSGSGMASGMSNMMMHKRRPMNQAGHFFGCIGQMLPAAIGAMAATGKKPAVLIDGDASFLMHLAEFETAVRYEIPLLVVVTNNQALGAEYYKLEVKKMNVETSQIPTPDLGALGVAMGGKGALVKNIDQLRAAVNEWVAKPCPMVIDMRISRTVMSIPYRRLHYGKDE
jgi:thiamine pyrophosphate-dependent acetolactate synthase large subunit-like protein